MDGVTQRVRVPVGAVWPRSYLQRLAGVPAWVVVALVGAVMGYAVIAQTPLAVGAVVGLLLLLVSTQAYPQLALLALAFSPLGTIIVVNTVSVDFRLTLMSWWLPAVGVLTLALLGRRKLVLSKGTVVLLVYAFYLVASFLWSVHPEVALREGIQFFTFVWIFLVIDNVVRTPRQLEIGTLAFLTSCSLLLVGSAISQLAVPILPVLRVSGGASLKFMREYYHVVTISSIAGSVFLISCALLIGARLSAGRRFAVSLALLVGLLFHAVVLKRLESLGLLFGGFLVFSLYGWRRSFAYLASGALLVVTIALAFPDLREHYEEATNVQETRWHYALPMAGFIMFKESPILGRGAGSFAYEAAPILSRMRILGVRTKPDDTKAPHNLVAKIGSEAGTVGLLLFGTFLGIVLWSMWKASRRARDDLPNLQALCRGMLGAACLQLVVSLGENVDNAAIFWIVLALGYRAARMQQESRLPEVAVAERVRGGPRRRHGPPRYGVPTSRLGGRPGSIRQPANHSLPTDA